MQNQSIKQDFFFRFPQESRILLELSWKFMTGASFFLVNILKTLLFYFLSFTLVIFYEAIRCLLFFVLFWEP